MTAAVRGYRTWKLSCRPTEGLALRSVYLDDIVWAGPVLTADEPPTLENGSGVHAFRSPRYCAIETFNDLEADMVCGEVVLWGRVAEHEWGYRGEHARIASLWDGVPAVNYDRVRPEREWLPMAAFVARELQRLYGVEVVPVPEEARVSPDARMPEKPPKWAKSKVPASALQTVLNGMQSKVNQQMEAIFFGVDAAPPDGRYIEFASYWDVGVVHKVWPIPSQHAHPAPPRIRRVVVAHPVKMSLHVAMAKRHPTKMAGYWECPICEGELCEIYAAEPGLACRWCKATIADVEWER